MGKALRIALIGGPYPRAPDDIRAGGELNRLRMMTGLADRGLQIDVFAPAAPGQEPRSFLGNPIIHLVPAARSTCSEPVRAAREKAVAVTNAIITHRAFWAHAYDCVLTHHWSHGIPLSQALPPHIPLIHTPHFLAAEKSRLWTNSCLAEIAIGEAALIKRSTRIVAVSAAEAASISRHYPGADGKITVIGNGVDPSFLRLPLCERAAATLHLVSVGRVCHQKGSDISVRAVEWLRSRGLEAQLTLAGESYNEPEFDAQIANSALNREGALNMRGPIGRSDLPQMLADADVYIQPSRYESQCIALLEAMGAGCLVIASNLPAVAEYIEHGVNGLLVTPGDVKALAQAVEFVTSMREDTRMAMRAAARRTAQAFTWESGVSKVYDLVVEAARCGLGALGDPKRQDTLLERARTIASESIDLPGVHAVLLTGSVARGTADGSSDVDLHFVVDDVAPDGERPPWSFSPDGIVCNVHQVELERLRWAASGRANGHVTQWLAEAQIADHFSGAELLETHEEHEIARLIERLVDLRTQPQVTTQIAKLFACRAGREAALAEESAEIGLPLQAQHLLRQASQHLLISTLVRCGWRIRGAKRRPELASRYVKCELVAEALDVLFTAARLEEVTPATATEIARERLGLRSLVVDEFNALQGASAEPIECCIQAAKARRHEANAFDYYLPAIRTGHYRGVVNHVRALSGFPSIPARFAHLFGVHESRAIDWLASRPRQISISLVDCWFHLADLSLVHEELVILTKRIRTTGEIIQDRAVAEVSSVAN